MLPERAVTPEFARTASADELDQLVHESDEQILVALPDNPNFTEKHAEALLGRLEISASVISAVAAAEKGITHEGVRLRIAQHPHTPKRLALTALRQMFLFDLVRVNQMPSVPGDIRRAAEEIIVTRIPHLAIGEKLTLARRAPARIASAILAEGHPQAMKLALANPFLTESQILKTLAKDGLPERVVIAISRHEKWSLQYNVRAALVRNALTPADCVQKFLMDLTLRDVQDFAALGDLSHETRRLIAAEVERRALQSDKAPGEKVP